MEHGPKNRGLIYVNWQTKGFYCKYFL